MLAVVPISVWPASIWASLRLPLRRRKSDRPAVELGAQLLRVEQELVRRGAAVEDVPLQRFP
jgi:hypothetical protein